jgi:serine/threonine protein kinase
LNIIGEGTFSQIFLVEDNKTHEKFALKKMAGTKLEDLEEKKYEFEFIMKLTKEDEKLNLVKIYGIQIKQLDKFNMVLYILMESAKSDWETELKNRHYDKKFYTEEELKNILLGLVQTFSSLQRRGICHRDVKPQNILSFGNGVYKITDFGEAKANKKDYKSNFSQDTSVQTVRGTELYMSPILFNALRQNPGNDLQYNAFKSDVFSLGLCFLLACTLSYKPLYQMRDANNMNTIKDIMEKYIKNRYSKSITELLYTMLQLEEKDRPDFIELESMVKKLFN